MPSAVEIFRDLHAAPRGFVMPNAWDAGSAIVLAEAGFSAIATTSAGIAFSMGRPDYAVSDVGLAVSREAMFERMREIVAASPVPVNGDLEAGWGDAPEAVAETIRLAVGIGLAGGNIEDADARRGGLYDEDLAVERIAAAAEAAAVAGFVLTARTDALMVEGGGGLDGAIRRANRFRQAGADCLYAPGVTDIDDIRILADEIEGPINVVMGLGNSAGSAPALLEAGVQRISLGGSIARSALGFVRACAAELLDAGTVGFAAGQIPQGELNTLFSNGRR
ncbi:isocitrate lyase/PEP mutase family protein [Caulobacter mirabilis]|uniref:2-methylisocitrate lyase n=1 Tax=Caulobacter mirabilis TaxID=69666 RepID=A0A2D2AUH2_9CAUL|nr:isocitrate lyase/phosphoenolpyruvate mutase family protein [Caulobacter mirabilis]ATQ41615.1 2-methylisocitrate lyase [Caulobacter mirabilis]